MILKSIWHGEGFSLIYYRELFMNSSGSIFYVSPVDAMTNSLLFACSTLAMALVVGGCAALTIQSAKGRVGNLLDPLFMLPLSTSAVTLGFGMIITLDKPPLNIRTSMMLIPIVHTLVAFPFVVRSVLPALRSHSILFKRGRNVAWSFSPAGLVSYRIAHCCKGPLCRRGVCLYGESLANLVQRYLPHGLNLPPFR